MVTKLDYVKGKKNTLFFIIILLIFFSLLGLNNFLKPNYKDVYIEKPLMGNPNAKVTITEYSDFQCPACKAAYFNVEALFEEFDGRINLEFKNFPLRTIHPYAQKAAEAAECANDFGKFWDYANLLYKNSPALSRSNLKNYARQLGLNQSFDACLDSGAKKLIVDSEYSEAVSKSLRGTPSFFINGKKLVQVQGLSLYDSLKTMIEAELNN